MSLVVPWVPQMKACKGYAFWCKILWKYTIQYILMQGLMKVHYTIVYYAVDQSDFLHQLIADWRKGIGCVGYTAFPPIIIHLFPLHWKKISHIQGCLHCILIIHACKVYLCFAVIYFYKFLFTKSTYLIGGPLWPNIQLMSNALHCSGNTVRVDNTVLASAFLLCSPVYTENVSIFTTRAQYRTAQCCRCVFVMYLITLIDCMFIPSMTEGQAVLCILQHGNLHMLHLSSNVGNTHRVATLSS